MFSHSEDVRLDKSFGWKKSKTPFIKVAFETLFKVSFIMIIVIVKDPLTSVLTNAEKLNLVKLANGVERLRQIFTIAPAAFKNDA